MTPPRRVVVTGLAYVTALGFNHEDHEPALRGGRSSARPISRFDTSGFRTRLGAQVDEARLEERLRDAGLPARRRRLALETRMLAWAVAAALEDAGMGRAGPPLPLVVGTTLEGFAQGELWHAERRLDPTRARPGRLREVLSGGQLAAVVDLLGRPLEAQVVSNACATGVSAIGRLFRRIRSGAAEAGLAGGYDVLGRFIHLGFDSLGALTADRCAPFDRTRSGFFIGDGAAILVLESLDSARRRRARVRGEILGCGESAEAHHPAHPRPDGAGIARAIARALESAGIRPEDVDYINAHGTGTPANDVAEARGILRAFGEEAGRRVPVSSTKALVGHTLGAAGAVEQCFSLLALERGFLPPQAHLREPDPGCPLNLVRDPAAGRPRIALNHAFGFGGANGVLVARRWEEEA
ncbi:MAG TPA: beta-ketoacyl-[acyl-carrier-protein] synthase family protein [Planctomycetota bacterium]|nr:beta-ketoacyl-[acyl-carrier-protein] synthase family protein [Planctomycetota bacterium]